MEDGNEQQATVAEKSKNAIPLLSHNGKFQYQMSMQQLPSYNDLVQRFSLFSQSPQCRAQIGPGGSLSCNCEGCHEWHAFVEGRSPDCDEVQYELFTIEHVKGLAHYFLKRVTELKLPDLNVLEVGAGSGRLCHHLNKFLSQLSFSSSQGCVVHLTATDSGERGLNGPNVAKKDAKEAISEAKPHIVLVSWMPLGVDWTAHMRATPSVLEYILIGEIDNGICGDPWLTWGYAEEEDSFRDSSSEDPTFLDASDGLLRTSSLSNYGPGRPVDMVAMDNAIDPALLQTKSFSNYGRGRPVDMVTTDKCIDLAHNCSEQKNSFEGLLPFTGVGFENREEEVLMESAQNHKRLRLDVEYVEKSSKCEDTLENIELEIVSSRKNRSGSEMPPYAADGWVRIELVSLSLFQICRTDERWSTAHHSHTMAFRRCTTGVSQSDTNN